MKSQQRHILILVENLPVPFDRRVWQEARALTAAGYRVSVICPMLKGYTAAYEELEGVRIYRHPLPAEDEQSAKGYFREYGAALWHQLRLAWRIYKTDKFHAIQACNPPDLLFLVALPFLPLGVRFMFDHHDINPELFEVKFGGRMSLTKRLLYKAVCFAERLTFFFSRRASMATNQSYKQIAVERGRMDPDRVFVVRSAPDLARFKPAPPNPGRWKKGRKHLVGYLGTIGPQEGLQFLVEAARILKEKRGGDVGWVVVGDGPARADVEALARREGLDAADITFTGRIDDATMIEAICSCDVCVNTDLATPMNDKSTMNKIIEYMALGRPIVQFELTEGRVSAGLASLYARPNDAGELADKVAELLDNPTLRRQMGEYGRRRVEEKLAWQYSVPVLLDAYETLFSGKIVRRAKEVDADPPVPHAEPARSAAPDLRIAGSVVA
ncbi:MAG TPA: glycosyltransferase family 4 protein [Tepidisphaeraceae bacterium]|nr:glycosyltransferase family 4 protein [Tepidisphaeraceae bacterium]